MADELPPQPDAAAASPRDLVAEKIDKAAEQTGVKDPLLIELAKEVMRRRKAEQIKGDLGNLALEVAAEQKNMTLGPDQKTALDKLVLQAEAEPEQTQAPAEAPPSGEKPGDKPPETPPPTQTAQAGQEAPAAEWGDEEPEGVADGFISAIESIEDDSWFAKLKKPLLVIAAAFASILAKLAQNKWISKYSPIPIRDGLISSELLAKRFNDEHAKLAVAGKRRLRKDTELLPDVLKKLAPMSAEKLVKAVKDPAELKKITEDPDQQRRLTFLAQKLQSPAVKKEMPVYEAVGAGGTYENSIVGTTLVADLKPPPPPSGAPAAPAAPQNQPTAVAAAPSPTQTPSSTTPVAPPPAMPSGTPAEKAPTAQG